MNPEMKNPFHFNRPTRPEDFLGRWAIVEQMVDDLYDLEGESYGIVGGRRFGKSSMLRVLEDSLAKRLKQEEIKDRNCPGPLGTCQTGSNAVKYGHDD